MTVSSPIGVNSNTVSASRNSLKALHILSIDKLPFLLYVLLYIVLGEIVYG